MDFLIFAANGCRRYVRRRVGPKQLGLRPAQHPNGR